MNGSEKSKRSKLSKRVSKLKSDSKSSSTFHSSLNCGIVVVNAVRNDYQHLMHFLSYEVLQRDFDIFKRYLLDIFVPFLPRNNS